ncbi:hypothetical protein [Chryseobacterium indologenes]|uniref:hypothetical protein n=1 Tax=Chryseobacterium indologenes TaxID=253 RepID=UPI001BCAF191|nr:hypothetical protein [Chryseobacterium indologenes]
MPFVNKDEFDGTQYYTIKTDYKVPYQVTFGRDLIYNRVSIHLFPLIDPEDDKCDHQLKRDVCDCIIDYFNVNNTVMKVHFELELNHERNNVRLYKFLKWGEAHRQNFNISADIIKINNVDYVDVAISRA